jgi:hypothetical protein
MSKSQRTKPDRTGELEIFPTPSWPVHRLLDRLNPAPGAQSWFEPCAGEGHIVRAVDAWMAAHGRETEITWTTTDIRPTRYAQPCADMTRLDNYFTQKSMTFDVVLSNPPFSKAMEMFRVCWPLAKRALVFLLPLSWLGSGERCAALRENTPSLLVLPERPIFRGWGTDCETYGWFCFRRRAPEMPATIEILPATPVEVRRASEREAASCMPREWQAEVEARRADCTTREKARQRKARETSGELPL